MRIRTSFTSISRQVKPGNKSGNFLIAVMFLPALVQWTHGKKAEYQETIVSVMKTC
ncbi:hypothetical protein [Acetobacter pasteurianus]|uniref:hypothetical protein n=1 Tax=Acetobacter pasteurianus TaxID=438 RepID=UPI0002457985|nr:hypothetical protein [Acetobacter pasteurianus]GAB31758.1 hypothetical protein APS_2360 [Acetobacter pasteurianus subsp. pasteurianus LMG 1262 = NBRC 106471]